MATRPILAAGALALLAAPALGEGVSVYDLGAMPSREACMQRASKVLNGVLRDLGGWEVTVTDWIVYGWDFGPGDLDGPDNPEVVGPNDVTLMCPIVGDGLVNAFLVVHGEGTEEERLEAADAIELKWNP